MQILLFRLNLSRRIVHLAICISIFDCVCAYLVVDMWAFQWAALGSAVVSAAALTPEFVLSILDWKTLELLTFLLDR